MSPKAFVETEVKFLYVDHPALRESLRGLGAAFVKRAFEENLVLDDAEGRLARDGRLLRLRRSDKCLLTFKAPPESGLRPGLKQCPEFESGVENLEAMREILARLGYRTAFSYEKFREEWTFSGCVVCLDTLPFGDFLEIEGSEENILRCVEALGLDMADASSANYHRLHAEFRSRSGLPPEKSFVFSPEEKARLEQID